MVLSSSLINCLRQVQILHALLMNLDDPLPYEFDLHWDCKIVADLFIWDVYNDPIVRRKLAEHSIRLEAIDEIAKSWDAAEYFSQLNRPKQHKKRHSK